MSAYDVLTRANPFETTFDVDPTTGFMPSDVPLRRLPKDWEPWEVLLDDAVLKRLAPGDKVGLTSEESSQSERWRAKLRGMPFIPSCALMKAEYPALARRAHVVLTFLLSFYIQTLPPDAPIIIPTALSIPLLKVSRHLDMPPVVTYSDTVLYNWEVRDGALKTAQPASPNRSSAACASLKSTTTIQASLSPCASILSDTIRSQTLFTGLSDEENFYLTAAKIELRGVEALDIMRSTMDELFVNDEIAVTRVTKLLKRFSSVVNDLRKILLDIRPICDPERYYNDVRPFFRGEDSAHEQRKWVFEGIEEYPELLESGILDELSGASAAQSSIIYALDAFLGVKDVVRGSDFMRRMQRYVPKPHRLFLDHLAGSPRPLRGFVMDRADKGPDGEELLNAYNAAVKALKEFRDGHMIIASLYIVGPARRAKNRLQDPAENMKLKENSLKGTGGTDLVKFLKGVRDQTKCTMLTAND